MAPTNMKRLQLLWKIVKQAVLSFFQDRCLKHSAALAYYTIFSLPCMLIIIISLGGTLYGEQALQGELYQIIDNYAGAKVAGQIEDVLANLEIQGNNIWATIIGIATLLFAATGIFGQIQDSINQIWGLQTKPEKSWLILILKRLTSFSMILVLGFILLISLTLNTVLELLMDRLKANSSDQIIDLVYFGEYLLGFIIITLLFLLIFKILPDATIKWRHTFIGAAITSVLFIIGKSIIGAYLTDTRLISAYGGTSSLIVLLIWVYYSSVILFLGAEITLAYVLQTGAKIEPNQYATFVEYVRVEKEEVNSPDNKE